MKEKILNIVVFYDNYRELAKYIQQIDLCARNLTDLIVVINKDTHRQALALKKLSSTVTLVDYGENVGYLNSFLLTIRKHNLKDYKFVILSNTDILYSDSSFFTKLSKKKYDDNVGCVAPCVISSFNKVYLNPHYRKRIPLKIINRNIRIFSHPILAILFFKLAAIKSQFQKSKKSTSCYVYSPHGCYMIFTRDFVKQIVGITYGVKMYSEESFIGEILRQKRMLCLYDQDLELEHIENTVTSTLKIRYKCDLIKTSLEFIRDNFYRQ